MILLLHQASGDHAVLLDFIRDYTSRYANEHGFAYSAVYGSQSDRHPYWDKLAVLIGALSSGLYEGVIYMDADTLTARPEDPLPLKVGSSGLGMCWHPLQDEPHWNVGVIHANLSALALLEAAWNKYPVEHRWPEQMALNWAIQEADADVYCLDPSFNETIWRGYQRTWVKAWHGGGSVEDRRNQMQQYVAMNRLEERVGFWPPAKR